MKRILIVNVNWLGDTLFATPFIRAVRENYPLSFIAVLTHPRCKEILEGNKYIDELIIYDEKGQHKSLWAKFSLASYLKSQEFDTAFILRKSLSRTMLLFLSKIPERIGYNSKRAGFLLTKKYPPPKNLHKVEYFLNLARMAGIEPNSVHYEFFISEETMKESEKILEDHGVRREEEYAALNPGGNWDLKRWPVGNFAKLGDKIFNRFNTKVVLSGAEKDIGLCKEIYSLMKAKPILLCGKTNLKTLAGIFKKAKYVISNDSGPMHLAAAVGAPLVVLFGPTSPEITGPYGSGVYKVLHKSVGCEIPCFKLSCRDNKCMKVIKVEDVMEAMS